jgi:hypothetical protein
MTRYDTSWQATGPLIERFGIELSKRNEWGAGGLLLGWTWADTPLLAACLHILALSAAGRLPPPQGER